MWTDHRVSLRSWRGILVLAAATLLAGCESAGLAPIEQKSTSAQHLAKPQGQPAVPPVPAAPPRTHRVAAGETLYAIAWRYGLDARDLGRWNRLDDFNRIFVGQELTLRAPAASPATPVSALRRPDVPTVAKLQAPRPLPLTTKPPTRDAAEAGAKESAPAEVTAPKPGATNATEMKAPSTASAEKSSDKPVDKEAEAPATNDGVARNAGGIAWQWPASGKGRRAVAATGAAGLDIKGERGQSVLAAADGQVVYSGNGLRGYGQLIIIKHNDTYLSAYAHNDKLLVGEGTKVKAGQAIAQMGDSESEGVMLHFEIRKAGVAVEPTQYLPPR